MWVNNQWDRDLICFLWVKHQPAYIVLFYLWIHHSTAHHTHVVYEETEELRCFTDLVVLLVKATWCNCFQIIRQTMFVMVHKHVWKKKQLLLEDVRPFLLIYVKPCVFPIICTLRVVTLLIFWGLGRFFKFIFVQTFFTSYCWCM